MPELEPRFEHDCAECVFIGHYADHDIYRCPQAGLPTLVARYGDDGPAYTSGPVIEINDITLAIARPNEAHLTAHA